MIVRLNLDAGQARTCPDGSGSGDHGSVERKPNLAKIQPDAGTEGILGLARGGVTDDLLGCLVDRDFIALPDGEKGAILRREGLTRSWAETNEYI